MRSLIGVANLCDLIVTVPGHPGIFHGADAEDISVAELLETLGARHDRLLPVPASLMRGLASLTGQRNLYGKLFQPLQIDQRATRALLHWQPPLTMAEQIEETVAWYRQTQ
jgi:UDP-glucose 4-epimerase